MKSQLIPNQPTEISQTQYNTLLEDYNNLKETSRKKENNYKHLIIYLIIFLIVSLILLQNYYFRKLLDVHEQYTNFNNNNLDKIIRFIDTLRKPPVQQF